MSNKRAALILAGGLGTRLRSVDQGLPKAMVPVCGEPFIYWLVKSLEKKGFDRFIFSTGYKGEVIESFPWSEKFPVSAFRFIRENSPLGTGGAVKNIFESDCLLSSAWVINGDTLLENGPGPEVLNSSLDVIYTALEPGLVFDASPNLVVDKNSVIKISDHEGTLFDGGQVFMTRKAVDNFSGPEPFSFHKLIQKSLQEGKVGFHLVPGTCYDIGTPDRLRRFENYLKNSIIA